MLENEWETELGRTNCKEGGSSLERRFAVTCRTRTSALNMPMFPSKLRVLWLCNNGQMQGPSLPLVLSILPSQCGAVTMAVGRVFIRNGLF